MNAHYGKTALVTGASSGIDVRQRGGSACHSEPRYLSARTCGEESRHPILFCVSRFDTVTPAAQTLRYAKTAPRGEIKMYTAGHFDFYVGDAFETLVRDQVEFLTRHLQPAHAAFTLPTASSHQR
jgi:hypothetical protein